MKTIRRTLIVATLTLCSSAFSAGLYKWVDASGVVHYGEQPPPGVNAQQIDIVTNTPVTQKAAETPPPAAPAATVAQKKVTPMSWETPADVERRQKNCDTAMQNLSLLKGNLKVTGTDPSTGEKKEIAGEERARMQAQAQAQADDFCR